MTGAELNTLINKYCLTNDTTFTQADKLVYANNVKNDLGVAIEKRNQQYFVIPSLFNLVASSVTAREYPWPDDVLSKIVSVQLAFATASPLDYVTATPYNGGFQQLVRDLNGLTEAKIVNLFSITAPQYYLTRRGIYILSGAITAVTDGGKLFYKAFPADLANLTGSTGLHIDPTTTSFGMPLQLHELWARQVAIIWKSQQPKPIPLSPFEQRYEQDLTKALDSLAIDDMGGEIIARLPTTNFSGDQPYGISDFPPNTFP